MLNLSNNQDVIQEILSHLDVKSLLNVSQTSKHLQQLVNAPIIWKRMLEKEDVKPKQDPKLEYIQRYTLLKEMENLKKKIIHWNSAEGKHGLYIRLTNDKEAVKLLMKDQQLVEKLNWHPLDLKTLCGLHKIDYQLQRSNQTEAMQMELKLSR